MVRLIAPQDVRPFVKRPKNDANAAEAIVIAGRPPEMRFVVPRTADPPTRVRFCGMARLGAAATCLGAILRLGRMRARKPNMRVALALANTRTRPILAMRTRNEAFKAPAPTAVV